MSMGGLDIIADLLGRRLYMFRRGGYLQRTTYLASYGVILDGVWLITEIIAIREFAPVYICLADEQLCEQAPQRDDRKDQKASDDTHSVAVYVCDIRPKAVVIMIIRIWKNAVSTASSTEIVS